MSCKHEQPKLYGQDKYEVEEAARVLTQARELETIKPKTYAAAIKLLEKRQRIIGAILQTKRKK